MGPALAAAFLCCSGLNALVAAALPAMPRAPLGIRLEADSAVETASLFGLGMRRLAADLGLIRLLIYYGTPEPDADEQAQEQGGGHYPELGPRALRILDTDPSFNYPVLYAAGALAFNLDRTQEALDLLEHALKRDPKNIQYHAYVAAIGFHRRGDVDSVIRILEPMLASPDCPTMIKSMVAFLYKNSGRHDEAARLYRDIIGSSRDPGYRLTAERMLKEMPPARD